MDYKILFGVFAAAILFFFGSIFAIASTEISNRLATSAFLFIAGFGILAVIYMISRKPQEIVQRIELSGKMKAVPITCPNCSGSIPPGKIKIVDGVPYAVCNYCGKTVEVAEEPKW